MGLLFTIFRPLLPLITLVRAEVLPAGPMAISVHETSCAGTNTLTGFCSKSWILGDNWVSQPVPGSCPPPDLLDPMSAGAWQRPGCFLAPVQGGGDLAGDILGLKRNSPPTHAWLSPINAVKARAAVTRFPRPSVHPCSQRSSPALVPAGPSALSC